MENRQLSNLMEAIAFQLGTLRWVDRWAVGKNNGGMYIRFFSKHAKFSIVVVYENDWPKLPQEIVQQAKQEGASLRSKRVADTVKDDLEDNGKMHDCPPMLITRFQYNPGKEKDRWWFTGIYRISQQKHGSPQATSEPPKDEPQETPIFESLFSALDWAIKKGVYQDREQAKVAFDGMRQRNPANSKEELSANWVRLVNQVQKKKETA